jgi:hypothetical protein
MAEWQGGHYSCGFYIRNDSPGWRVDFYGENGKKKIATQSFSYRRFGSSDLAKAAAEAWRDQKAVELGLPVSNRYRILPDYAEVTVGPDDAIMKIDVADLHYVIDYYWCLCGDGYVSGRAGYLSRMIMQCPRGREVDHINNDKLDNRRSNLRLATRLIQIQNRRTINSNNTSGENGVSLDLKGNRYRAYYWDENGKKCSKSFAFDYYGGKDGAFIAAKIFVIEGRTAAMANGAQFGVAQKRKRGPSQKSRRAKKRSKLL